MEVQAQNSSSSFSISPGVHIAAEVIALVGVTYFVLNKTSKLDNSIHDLVSRIDDLEDLVAQQDNVIRTLLDRLKSSSGPKVSFTPQAGIPQGLPQPQAGIPQGFQQPQAGIPQGLPQPQASVQQGMQQPQASVQQVFHPGSVSLGIPQGIPPGVQQPSASVQPSIPPGVQPSIPPGVQQPTASMQQPTASMQQPTASMQQPTANISKGVVLEGPPNVLDLLSSAMGGFGMMMPKRTEESPKITEVVDDLDNELQEELNDLRQ